MTAPASADPVGQAVAGCRAAVRTLDAVLGQFALPDRVFEDVLDIVAADGGPSVRTERLRAYCRALQKRLEASR